jgi:hypothetical protein
VLPSLILSQPNSTSCLSIYLSSVRSSHTSPSSSCELVIPGPTHISGVGSRTLVLGFPSFGHRYPMIIFTKCTRRTIASFPNPYFSLPSMMRPSCPGSGCSRDANFVQGNSLCQLSIEICSATVSSLSDTSVLGLIGPRHGPVVVLMDGIFYALLRCFALCGFWRALCCFCPFLGLPRMCVVAGALPFSTSLAVPRSYYSSGFQRQAQGFNPPGLNP